MKERIIVIPGRTDIAKTLAYHGKPVFNTRFFDPVELARESLMRKGCPVDKGFVSLKEETAFYFDIVKDIPYFGTCRLGDLKKINSTVDTIRKLIVKDEKKELKEKLYQGRFLSKNKALYEAYERYMDVLEKEDLYDSISLMREAMRQAQVFDSEIFYVKEYPLLPLEAELVNVLSGGKAKEISLFDLFGIEEKKIHVDSYKNCYGSGNEAAMIVADAFENAKADECVIACSDYRTYAQIFYDLAVKYDIPIAFSDGVAVVNSYPGKLLKLYDRWMNEDGFGWDSFLRMICSPCFDRKLLVSLLKAKDNDLEYLLDKVSRMRLSNDREKNRELVSGFVKAVARDEVGDNERLRTYLDDIKVIAEELSLPMEDFLNKYSLLRMEKDRDRQLDQAALRTIVNEIVSIRDIGVNIDSDIISSILRKNTYRRSPLPGHLYVCPIEKAACALRRRLYVCGLSSASYPGPSKEDPLLLDCDLEDLGNQSLTSRGKILKRREDLFQLIALASSLGNQIHISYPGLNVSELKANNASSLLFELFRMENGDDKQLSDLNDAIVKAGYFEPKLSIGRKIGEAYNRGDAILYESKESTNTEKEGFKLRRYSPSQLNTFFNCKKQYFYQNILYIPQPDDYDPYALISPTELGTLVHSLMEHLSEHPAGREDFLDLCGTVFDEYLDISVPLVRDKASEEKEQFLEMMDTGWRMDERFKRKVAFKEEDKEALHEGSGVRIHGFPDRVEIDENGKAVIIDFKTERNLNAHVKDDIDSCLQVVIYAYIVEKTMGLQVDHCEYRMLRGNVYNGLVTCKYDDEIKKQLDEKLKEFRRCVETGDFGIGPMSPAEEKDRCKYCKYGAICGKVITEEVKE